MVALAAWPSRHPARQQSVKRMFIHRRALGERPQLPRSAMSSYQPLSDALSGYRSAVVRHGAWPRPWWFRTRHTGICAGHRRSQGLVACGRAAGRRWVVVTLRLPVRTVPDPGRVTVVWAVVGDGQYAVAGLSRPGRRGCRSAGRDSAAAAWAGPVRCLPEAVQGRPARRPARPVRDRPAGRRGLAFPAFRGGGLPARAQRLGHHLRLRLQPALRVLPELRHLLASARRAGDPRGGWPR